MRLKIIRPKIFLSFLFVLLVGFILWIASKSIANKSANVTNLSPIAKAGNVPDNSVLATKTINQEVNIPVGSAGETVNYTIESAELRKQILVKGQPQTAVEGRLFLIFNLKLTNNLSKGLNINTRDFVRLSINDGSEKLAPDIHNDPVEVQAISTKYTRLGFPVNETDKKFNIQLGDIKGEKINIPLEF